MSRSTRALKNGYIHPVSPLRYYHYRTNELTRHSMILLSPVITRGPKCPVGTCNSWDLGVGSTTKSSTTSAVLSCNAPVQSLPPPTRKTKRRPKDPPVLMNRSQPRRPQHPLQCRHRKMSRARAKRFQLSASQSNRPPKELASMSMSILASSIACSWRVIVIREARFSNGQKT